MSVTPRPRRAFVSSSGDSNYILPHSMGWIHDLGNLWEFLPHLLLGHEICLFQDMSRLIIAGDGHSVRVDRFPNFHRGILYRVLNITSAGCAFRKFASQLASYGAEESSDRAQALRHVANRFHIYSREEDL